VRYFNTLGIEGATILAIYRTTELSTCVIQNCWASVYLQNFPQNFYELIYSMGVRDSGLVWIMLHISPGLGIITTMV